MSDRPERKKHALNNNKLVLSTPCPTAKGKYSQMKWDIYMNAPRIIVRTNDPSDSTPEKGYGNITAALDAPTFYAFLAMLEQAFKSSGEWKAKIENYNHDFVNGKRSQEIVHISDLWVGKDKDGVVFCSVISKKDERPVIKFAFGPSDTRYHKIFHADGQPYSKGELSVLYAKSYHRLLGEVMSNLLVTEYKEPPKPNFGNKGGNGGGYNRGGNGSYNNNNRSGSSSSSDDADGDDLPF